MLTIWWSRTAGILCVFRSTPVSLRPPTDSSVPPQGFDQTPPPCPPPHPEPSLHGSVWTHTHTHTIREWFINTSLNRLNAKTRS